MTNLRNDYRRPTTTNQMLRGSIALAVVVATGCVAPGEASFEGAAEDEVAAWMYDNPVAATVGEDSIVGRLGLPTGRWYDLGPVEVAPPGARAQNIQGGDKANADRPEVSLPEGSFIRVDAHEQRQYLIELTGEERADIGQAMEALEMNVGTLGDRSDETAMALERATHKAVSGGVDTRIRRGVLDGYAIDNWPYRVIGRTTSSCTGTMVGENYYLTAAHCMFQEGTGAAIFAGLQPRRDGLIASYGTWDAVSFTYYTAYVANNCHIDWVAHLCEKYDIALVEVEEPWYVPTFTDHPGWMGFNYMHGSTLAGFSKWNRGYPSCGGTDAPASCTSNTLYGDTNACSLGSFRQPDGDGWNQLIDHGCDTNGGHSGSAVYLYDSGTATVIGVHISGRSNSGSATPNSMRRITPEWYSIMLSTMGL